jgi:transposase
LEAQPGVKEANVGADRAAEMYEMYAGGATLQQVGAWHNISRERVRQVFKRYGYSIRTVRDVAERTRALEVRRADDILSTHTELKDVREVARRLGVSQVTVRDVVRAAERANPQPASRSRRKFGSTRKRYSDEELLECLKIASQELGGVLTTEAYVDFVKERTLGDGRPWPSSQVYRLRFGSWVDALHKAGLRANARTPIAGRPLFTVAHCTDAVGHLARQLGHAPTAAEYDLAARASGGALPSLATIRQRCGGWLGALRAAGL